MRTSIRLAGRARLASRFIAVTVAASLAAAAAGATVAASPAGLGTLASPGQAASLVAAGGSTRLVTAPAAAAPIRATSATSAGIRPAGILASTACSLAATTWSCDLFAKAGSLVLPDATSVPIWGYAATAAAPAGLPGPALIVTAGNDLSITLHNVDLPNATSLSISELPGVPDTTGVTAGSATTYTIPAAALAPGTYLYEAGLTPYGPRQVAMGLYGALVVRPASCGAAANCAYDASSAFDDEALVLISEVDPAFNAAPATYNLGTYSPKYWLIDGKGYPSTDPIPTDAGHHVLLRYLNAGLVQHSMTLLGLHEQLIASDAKPTAGGATVVADTIPAGSTIDAIAGIPATAPGGTQFALFEAAMHLDNAGGLASPGASNPALTPISFGGMLTFLAVAGSTTPTGGPVTSAVSATPNPADGSVPVSLTATITSATSTVSAAEYFVDAVGTDGAGCAISGSFGTAVVTLTATIPTSGATAPCPDLATLTSGNHTLYVHGRDATGAWGDPASTVLDVDKAGPITSAATVTPDRTNGTLDVALQATASDATTGGQNVTAAEYFIDPAGTPAPGSGTAFTIATPATDVSLAATLPAATVAGLGEGAHTIAIRARDAAGNWGAFATITLTLDTTGPAASAVVLTPNPTNGLFGVQIGSAGQLYERIDATITDPLAGGVNSGIVAAEYFIDTVGANGTGGGLLAASGSFGGSTTANVTGAAELFAIAALPSGNHTVFVHGKDAAGNWGPTSTATLVVDRSHPYITTAGLAPNPTRGANTVTLNVTAIDVANINRIEYFIGADPGQGLATALTNTTPSLPAPSVTGTATVNISNLALGSATVSVRARNASGAWSPVTALTLTISPLFADGFDAGTFAAWSSRGGTLARTTVVAAAAQAGAFGMAAQILSGTSGYVQNNTPVAETRYHARFYLKPNGVTLTNLTPYTIFMALNNTNATRFSVRLRRNGSQYQVAGALTRNGGTTTGTWFTIPASTFSAIEMGWSRSGNALSLGVSIGGVLQQTITGNATNATAGQYRIDTVRLGPQGALGGATGTLYFDSFVSTRTVPAIGP
jgi:FtsP/CotA-like multicopper oxidase with cupredoxin domain